MTTELEDRLGLRARQALNHSTERLDARVTERLFQSRRLALESFGEGKHRPRSGFGQALVLGRPKLVALLMAMALSVGMLGTYYWNLFEEAGINEAIDSELLADDIPPDVYIDQGFRAWLERASSDTLSQ